MDDLSDAGSYTHRPDSAASIMFVNSYRGQIVNWTREKLLTLCGLLLIGAEFVNGEVRGGAFHYEFLMAGIALCGIGITSWGDKK